MKQIYFNPTIVRLRPEELKSFMMSVPYFNPTIVRLRHEVSVAFSSQVDEFQSYHSAIKTLSNHLSKSFYELYFNPTIVRLRLIILEPFLSPILFISILP